MDHIRCRVRTICKSRNILKIEISLRRMNQNTDKKKELQIDVPTLEWFSKKKKNWIRNSINLQEISIKKTLLCATGFLCLFFFIHSHRKLMMKNDENVKFEWKNRRNTKNQQKAESNKHPKKLKTSCFMLLTTPQSVINVLNFKDDDYDDTVKNIINHLQWTAE